MDDIKRRKAAFRVAFDYLERQAAKMPAFATAERYFAQACEELERIGNDAPDELTRDLLVDAYADLERLWLERDTA